MKAQRPIIEFTACTEYGRECVAEMWAADSPVIWKCTLVMPHGRPDKAACGTFEEVLAKVATHLEEQYEIELI